VVETFTQDAVHIFLRLGYPWKLLEKLLEEEITASWARTLSVYQFLHFDF